MSRQHIYDQRWRAKHPDRYAATNRRKSAQRSAASRILRERHREEYDALLARDADEVPSRVRQEQAMRVLRERHPDHWAEARDAARQEVRTDD